jgi:hypothetical protein
MREYRCCQSLEDNNYNPGRQKVLHLCNILIAWILISEPVISEGKQLELQVIN